MTIQEIIRALRSLQVETGSLACLGCAHENSCSTKGCAILRQAAEAMEQQSVEVEGMRSAANSLKMHLEKATAERDAAVNDLRGCSIESCAECMYCIYRTARSFCQNCQDGSEWKYRGPKKDRQKPEPLTPAQVKAMDYEKIWINYGDDGEWGIVVDGLLYSISTLEGAGFVDMLQDAVVRGEDVERQLSAVSDTAHL